AQTSYERGLGLNEVHYKCLTGLFDLAMMKKNHAKAYSLVRQIAQVFPLSPARLNSALQLAVMTQNYDDVSQYFDLYFKLEYKAGDSAKYVSAALVVCGVHYLRQNDLRRALQMFHKATISSRKKTGILREI